MVVANLLLIVVYFYQFSYQNMFICLYEIVLFVTNKRITLITIYYIRVDLFRGEHVCDILGMIIFRPTEHFLFNALLNLYL